MSTETASEPELGARETERIRNRVRLMVEITARSGSYRKGLAKAAGRLTPEEAAIIADLEQHGLDVEQLRDVLCGGHVLVDEPSLYQRWRFPNGSRERISSHHKSINKKEFPDIGMKGPLVREKLHGRTSDGTWVQLEKTPASLGARKLPSWQDVQHLIDYIVYRVTKRNVGPWGLSGKTERRPMYLSPDLGATVPLPEVASDELTGALSRIEEDDDTTSASPDLARRFPPPDRANDLLEIAFRPGESPGRGLFGGSDVWITETASEAAREVFARDDDPAPPWSLPPAGETRAGEVRASEERSIPCAIRLVPAPRAGSPAEGGRG